MFVPVVFSLVHGVPRRVAEERPLAPEEAAYAH
jgi:hypothetical protein